nr:uncharacterized protein LOC117835322 [Setaria viridis]
MEDAQQIICSCEGCQYYTWQTHVLAQELQTILITWPFVVWGLDLVGPFKRAPRGYTHLLVVVDQFTKSIEAKPITQVTSATAVEFFLDIVYKFRVPNSINTNNGTQFTGRKFLRFCDHYHIRVDYAFVAHLRTNGQVERANGMVLQGLKPRIFDRLKKFTGGGKARCPWCSGA